MEIVLSENIPFSIGRGTVDLRLKGLGDISRKHCFMMFDDKKNLKLVDQSRNGTFHNGIPVKECVLQVGDVIQIAHTEIKILEIQSANESGVKSYDPSVEKSGATVVHSAPSSAGNSTFQSPAQSPAQSTAQIAPSPITAPPMPKTKSPLEAENNSSLESILMALDLVGKKISTQESQLPIAIGVVKIEFEELFEEARILWKKRKSAFVELALKQSIVATILIALFLLSEIVVNHVKVKKPALSLLLSLSAIMASALLWRLIQQKFFSLEKLKACLQISAEKKQFSEVSNLRESENQLMKIFQACLLSFERKPHFLDHTILSTFWKSFLDKGSRQHLARFVLQSSALRNETDHAKQLRLICLFAQYHRNILPQLVHLTMIEAAATLSTFSIFYLPLMVLQFLFLPQSTDILAPFVAIFATLVVHSYFIHPLVFRSFVILAQKHWVESMDPAIGWVNALRELSPSFEKLYLLSLQSRQIRAVVNAKDNKNSEKKSAA